MSRDLPPPGKVWVCTRCSVQVGEPHQCRQSGDVMPNDSLVAAWPREVRGYEPTVSPR